jgi:stage V sporulation protein G
MSVEVKKMTEGKGAIRAFCDITIADRVTVKGCRVVEGNNGLFVAMPQTKGKDEKWYPIVWIETDKLKEAIHSACIQSYEENKGSSSQSSQRRKSAETEDFPEDDI